MKRIRKILILILICFITGCSNCDMTMKVNKNKSLLYSIVISSEKYNEDFIESVTIYKDKLEKYGYIFEQNDDVIVVSKVFDNIDDISNAEKDYEFNLLYMFNDNYNEEVESKMFNAKHNFVNSSYIANFYVDLSSVGIVLNKNMNVKYIVELPYRVKTTNAVNISEDGKRLIWDINSSNKVEIDYEFELKNYDYIYQIVAYLFAIYLLFSIISNLFGKKDDDKDFNSENYDYKRTLGNSNINKENNSDNAISDNGDININNLANNKNTTNNINNDNLNNMNDVVNNNTNNIIEDNLINNVEVNNTVVDINNVDSNVQVLNTNNDFNKVEPVILNDENKVYDNALNNEDKNISGEGVIKFNSKSIVVNNKEDK